MSDENCRHQSGFLCPYCGSSGGDLIERIGELEEDVKLEWTLRHQAEARVKELEADAASWRRMKQHIRELRGEDSG